jgi:hypothetical protein
MGEFPAEEALTLCLRHPLPEKERERERERERESERKTGGGSVDVLPLASAALLS